MTTPSNLIINKDEFFNVIKPLFGKKFTQGQVQGIDAIIEEWERRQLTDVRWLAYILATVYHETGGKMEPVREGFATTDAAAIAHVTRMFQKKQISTNYALPAGNGKSYFGRGHVQVTWPVNYLKLSELAKKQKKDWNFYSNPELLLQTEPSIWAAFEGMIIGLFTGRKLSQYFNATENNPIMARLIINGIRKGERLPDKAEHIAGIHNKFYSALML